MIGGSFAVVVVATAIAAFCGEPVKNEKPINSDYASIMPCPDGYSACTTDPNTGIMYRLVTEGEEMKLKEYRMK